MAKDYRQRKTIQIKLNVTEGHEHAEVNQLIYDYQQDLAKHGNWMQSFRDMVMLYGSLKEGDMKLFKKLFPGIYLSMVNSALLEAQEKVLDKLVEQQAVKQEVEPVADDQARKNWDKLKSSLDKLS